MKIKKSTIWAFSSILLYKIVLDLSYYLLISRIWGYAQFDLNLSVLKLVESYLLLFVVFALMPKSSEKLSNVMVWLLVLVAYMPMLTIFAFMNEARIYMYAVTGFFILVFLLLHLPTISLPPLKQSKIILYSISICLVVIVFALIYKNLGFSLNLDLTKVYEIRSQDPMSAIPLGGYIINWVALVINPIFLALFITKRKWVLAGIIIFLQIWLFSITGHKSHLFVLPFVLVLMWIITRRNPLAYMGVGLAGLTSLGMITYWLADNLWIASSLVRRVLFVPAQLSFFYYDFFSKNELVYLSVSKLGSFSDYPYHLDPGHLIGQVYFNQPATNAVTGVVGDAYMNFGLVGLALYGILLVIVLKLVDSCSRNVDFRVGIAAAAIPAIGLVNSALTTSFLTGGLLLALIILYLLPKKSSRYLA
jgi:hypothetical protein